MTNTPRAPTRSGHSSALVILASKDPAMNVRVGRCCANVLFCFLLPDCTYLVAVVAHPCPDLSQAYCFK